MNWHLLFIVGLGALSAKAQFENRSSVLDSSGALSSGGAYTSISAAGQPGGIASSSGGPYHHQAGFLNTFSLEPELDSDSDGLADELDQDNDNDGLADATEITGGGFNPVTPTQVNQADSDGDGIPDGHESAAGTDPTDANAQLEIIHIAQAAGQQVGWIARGGKTYVIKARTDLPTGSFAAIATNTAVGGSAPWFVVTNQLVDASSSDIEFYAVEVLP